MAAKDLVNITVDGKECSVPMGTNLIEAAKLAEVEIPFYCYHPHLSVPGNCRMCQVEVEGAPKLMIGCHTQVREGMVIKTHQTSQAVSDAQSSTLEMLLINHPLDCTVCDQAGHCKLQDYHFEYNAKPSRFLEDKQKKPKAVSLGPTVMLDAERCIACTRCVRFCDEVTETGEIGLLNRGDKYFIAVDEQKPLANPLSGTVVDLCPVGALTHKEWRFNTRLWYSNPENSICLGCSTGCNVKAFVRDEKIVQIKARENAAVNKEWMCDEGRYGFERFFPKNRVKSVLLNGDEVSFDGVKSECEQIKKDNVVFLVAANLTLEEYAIIQGFKEQVAPKADVAVSLKTRALTKEQAVLVSPDYAANFYGAVFAGLIDCAPTREAVQSQYEAVLKQVLSGKYDSVVLVGDWALAPQDLKDLSLLDALRKTPFTLGMLTDLDSELCELSTVVLPSSCVYEGSGLYVNANGRLQYGEKLAQPSREVKEVWKWFGLVADALGHSVVEARSNRDLTLSYLGAEERLSGLTIRKIKRGIEEGVGASTGIDIVNYKPKKTSQDDESKENSEEDKTEENKIA